MRIGPSTGDVAPSDLHSAKNLHIWALTARSVVAGGVFNTSVDRPACARASSSMRSADVASRRAVRRILSELRFGRTVRVSAQSAYDGLPFSSLIQIKMTGTLLL